MTEPNLAEYFANGQATEAQRRRYAQNSLIVDTAIAVNRAIEIAEMSQKDLAQRLGRTEGFISQVLNGGANLTLRTLADVAYGLDCVIDIALKPASVASMILASKGRTTWNPVRIKTTKETAANCQHSLAA
jgi:ribosome-binding protein aMBF1 (putative translation factor)